MAANIEGRPVVVTGGGNGIGAALALEAARRGASAVAVVDVDACLQLVDDPTYPPGTAVAPDSAFSLVNGPVHSAASAGICSSTAEATVLRVGTDWEGVIWLELECGRSTGWVLESELAE